MKQFSAYGAVTSVSLEKRAADATANGGGGGEDASSLAAVINYENRIDAERVGGYAHTTNMNDDPFAIATFLICMFALLPML